MMKSLSRPGRLAPLLLSTLLSPLLASPLHAAPTSADISAAPPAGGFSRPASPQVRALILTIGAYRNGIPALSGVARDAESARAIAQRMGVPDNNIVALRDEALTLAGLRKAFDRLEAELGDNDELFIYYSGHGSRQKVQEADGSERCAESLVSVDGQAFLDRELDARLKRLSSRARKLVVFIDACHSGGVTTRTLGRNTPFTAKFWQGGSAENCSRPVNVLTRNIVLTAARPGQGGGNFAYIAAARADEISLDQPGRGGVATQSWLACMAGGARDSNGSGGLSAEEIRECAQREIDGRLKDVPGYLPHHVAITGNAGMVLSYAPPTPEVPAPAPAAMAPTPPIQAPATSVSPPVAAPAPTAPAASPPSPPGAIRRAPLAALQDIYNNRDDRRLTHLSTDRPQLRIGQDKVSFTLSSREGGYVYLLMAGSDGEAFDLLFPNSLDNDNRIHPGETLRLPRQRWELEAQGPAGRNTVLAIVSDTPRDFSRAGLKPSGPFSSAGAHQAKDIQLVTAQGSNASEACEPGTTPNPQRTLAIRKRCAGTYGAALLTLEEIAP